MSEPVLKALIKLFAFVAREDEVTHQERQQILSFLTDHLSQQKVKPFMDLFDRLSQEVKRSDLNEELKAIDKITTEVNQELTQKQKSVIMVELVVLVFADQQVSSREEELIQAIANQFNISKEEVSTIKKFVFEQEAAALDDESILIAANEKTSLQKSEFKQISGLNGMLVFLYLKQSDIFFFKYLGQDDLLLNGVPQKKDKISVYATGSILRSDHTEPVYFGDIQKRFKKSAEGTPITFEARNISFRFKKGNLGLRNVNINEESGRLIALMGASGAGKSTLLHVLNGSEQPSEGEVLINGINLHKEPEKLEGVIGFVPQDDLLIEDLTVYQNLYFAAKLCFSHYTENEIEILVTKTLEDLGLYETKDLKVGSPLQKTISGGQRKRLNIGLELLREP
ncbi:MAG TPA: ATP-binding cassette domain-containing protein, partial [Cyclobacteriaceae bacterium]|nr:ATP-binding cassette domain-containing protein [Cyclobacteriaceae bacterium]